jgi:N-acetylmuramoyl-L-alanine amidase
MHHEALMPTRHEVQQGDCLSSIAAQYGISWERIWNFGENADLKSRRKDPNVLFPGDVVVVPDVRAKTESGATGMRHSFVTPRKPTNVKIRLTIDDEPRAGLAYELIAGGLTLKGSTDGDGYLKAEIPPDVSQGRLIVGTKEPREIYELAFGTLDPIETDEGIEERLRSLGYNTDGALSDAIAAFQAACKLEATGTADDALRGKLKEKFGQ